MKILRKCKLILAIFALCLLIVGCTDEKSVAQKSKKSKNKEIQALEMYIATDLHYLSPLINDEGEAFEKMLANSDGRQANYIKELTDAFQYELTENKPEVLIISGDLTHNGEKQSHLDLAEKFKEIEDKGTEVFLIPGNHDINNPYAREFKEKEVLKTETVSSKEFENIYQDFGYGQAISRDADSLSYLAEASENLWLLMLDTNLYEGNQGAPTTNGKVKKETLKWIKEASKLAKESGAEIVTVMHHNLYKHSELMYKGFTLDNADELLAVLKENDLKITLSGHVHIQDIMADEDAQVYDIVSSAFTVYPIQYGILNFDEKSFKYQTQLLDVEKWARETNLENEELLNFNSYSKDYFFKASSDKAFSELIVTDAYEGAEAREMADIMALLNIHYFGGTTNDVREEVLASNGYELWQKKGRGFFKNYVFDLTEKDEQDHNYLEINHE